MQHTEKYNFSIIDADDPFSPDALNDNARTLETQLARVDGEIARVDGTLAAAVKFTCGTYDGNGGVNRKIPLSFTPKVVFVAEDRGLPYLSFGSEQHHYGGLAMEGVPVIVNACTLMEIVSGGFQVSHYAAPGYPTYFYTTSANQTGKTYRWFAIG